MIHSITSTFALSCDETYAVAPIPNATAGMYLHFMYSHLSEHEYYLYRHNQQQHDNEAFYMPIITDEEFHHVPRAMVDAFIGYPITIQFLGLGSTREAEDTSMFIVATCSEAISIRAYLKLPVMDFYVTLGFSRYDVVTHPRNKSTLLFPFACIEEYDEIAWDMPKCVVGGSILL